jgi:acyl-CoA reductase-like NAD-dependent aldehyde dehydrogenase
MEMTMLAVTKIREDETSLKKERMLIGGKWVDSASGEWLKVEDPAHRRPIAEVPRGRSEDVARAVKAATDAFPAWSRTVPRERGRLLSRIADVLEGRVEELARTIALETGNALRTQARTEAKTTVDIIRYFGGLGGELKGETIPFGEQVLSYTRREPLGVVGAIIPWSRSSLVARAPQSFFPDANEDWVVDGIISGNALYPAKPILYRRLAAFPPPRHLR